MLFIGGLSSIYACIIAKDLKSVSIKNLAKMFSDGVKTISPSNSSDAKKKNSKKSNSNDSDVTVVEK